VVAGANAIASISNDTHIALYNTLLDKIVAASPSSVIVICSMTPYGLDYNIKYPAVNIPARNLKINSFNMKLLEMAKARGFYFLNVAEAMTDSSGNLDSRYAAPGDGLHWSALGRTVYINYVLTHHIPGR
jgi:hypothetical protein